VAQAATKPPRPTRKAVPITTSPTLRVTAYDRAASMVISLLVLVGAGVLFLIVGWLSSGIFHYDHAVPVKMEELAGGGYENGIGTEGQNIEAPTESDIAAESDILESEVPDTLTAMVEATASSESMDRFDMQFAPIEAPRPGGRSTGTGKHPAKGTGGGHGGGAPRENSWEIRFPPGNTVETYGKQLDFFGIELGVLEGVSEVTYINKLGQEKPAHRTGVRSAEGRKTMTWSRGDLDQADQELFTRAGIKVDGRPIFKFLPPETENKLAALERGFKNRAPKDIRRTRFGLKPEGAGWAFYVIDQTYY